MSDLRLGALIRAVRVKRGLRQQDVAEMAGVSHGSVSLVERGHCQTMSLELVRRIASALDIRVEAVGRWRGGDAERLLSRRHSTLAETFASFMRAYPEWTVEPEISFAVYRERGVIDQLAWRSATEHLLVVELKTEFADINEMLGTLDRKVRLAPQIVVSRGWRPKTVSVWAVIADTRTNRRHAAEHAALLRAKFPCDGRRLDSFLRSPSARTAGLGFMTNANRGSAGQHRPARTGRSRPRNGPTDADSASNGPI